jgi:hypothetical protein
VVASEKTKKAYSEEVCFWASTVYLLMLLVQKRSARDSQKP